MPSPTHYYLRRGRVHLADRSGRTTSLPAYPYAWNTCDLAEADALAAELNSELPTHAAQWTVEILFLNEREPSFEAATEAADDPIAA